MLSGAALLCKSIPGENESRRKRKGTGPYSGSRRRHPSHSSTGTALCLVLRVLQRYGASRKLLQLALDGGIADMLVLQYAVGVDRKGRRNCMDFEETGDFALEPVIARLRPRLVLRDELPLLGIVFIQAEYSSPPAAGRRTCWQSPAQCGRASRHGPHQVAQKSISTTLPARSSSETTRLSIVLMLKAGAIRARTSSGRSL